MCLPDHVTVLTNSVFVIKGLRLSTKIKMAMKSMRETCRCWL